VDGPLLSIVMAAFSVAEALRNQPTEGMLELLRACAGQLNIIVSGGTGAGKTTRLSSPATSRTGTDHHQKTPPNCSSTSVCRPDGGTAAN
jgi:hypothetical protein